jgi:CelD/BcsL family acetyltransferase involved in cellulose biosynthesis
MSVLTTAEIRDVDTLDLLVPQWWNLWRRIPSATPFQTPAWLVPWWRAFSPGRLLVITVQQAGRLVGLAPFYIEQGALGRRVLPIGISTTDYIDVLLDPECIDSAAAALVEHLAAERTWREWELTDLAPDAFALRLPEPSGCTTSLQPASPCPVLALPREFDALLRALSPNKRNNLHNARNRAKRRGDVHFMQADAVSAPGMLESLMQLHAARWTGRGEQGVFSDPRVRAFHAAAIPLLFEADLARLFALKICGRTAAVHYGLSGKGRAYSYITGFDPEFSFESPGALLLAHVIDRSIGEDTTEFHFLRGQEKYKYEWAATDRWNVRRVFRRDQARARAS